MKVFTLITIPNKECYENCTLFINSVRTAFPTADIVAYLNLDSLDYESVLLERCHKENIILVHCNEQNHHAKFIQERITNNDKVVIIIDPDTIFWKNCEDFKFTSLIAGRYVPPIWNEFSKCISHDRLHTSFLWFTDCAKLRNALREAYPQGYNTLNRTNEFAPFNPFISCVQFVNKTPLFWDTCSSLYNTLGGEAFKEEHLDCYDHLNSTSFGEVMYKVMECGDDLKKFHEAVKKNPLLAKGMWKNDEAYYQRMHNKVFTQSQL